MPAEPLADSLCHYTTAEAAFAWILPSGELRLSPFSKMRDPFETGMSFMASWYGERPDIEARYAQATAALDRQRAGTKLLSFSIDAGPQHGYDASSGSFRLAWARARLWEQYAEAHRGVCLAFDRKSAEATIYGNLHELGVANRGEVVYLPRGVRDTRARTLMDTDLPSEGNFEALARYQTSHHTDLFLTKTLDWQSEHEFRFTVLRNYAERDAHAFVRYETALRAVIVGERFPPELQRYAKAACERAGVELLRMHWKDGFPWLLTME